MGRAFERGRNVVRHELFQEAMGAMNRLGEELASVDSRLEAEGLRLVEERCKLRVAINLGRYHRDLENMKEEASLKVANEARSRPIVVARLRRSMRGSSRPGVRPWSSKWRRAKAPLRR